MGCGVRHAGCGLCAPAARGRGRERSGEGRGQRESTGQRDSIADGTALRCAGEAVKAHRECPGDIRRSKCAARVCSALTAEQT